MSAHFRLIYPLFAMFVLSAVVLILMFRARVRAVKKDQVKISYFKTYENMNLPEDVIKTARHFINLFEAPVLFYVICLLGIILSIENLFFLFLAWIYVALRAAHAYVHIGRNQIRYRMMIYGLGWVVMAVMWVFILMKMAD